MALYDPAVALAMNEDMTKNDEAWDVLIVGGGPGGLSAALTLGRARKRVLLCDAGPRRNAKAAHMQNFVTRDGTPPEEFRRIAREQLARYPNVVVRDVHVASIAGSRGEFRAEVGGETVVARRIVLATGMIDDMLPIPGFRELWGSAIFQCPYCHGWEVQDPRSGYLVTAQRLPHLLPSALMMRSWTNDVTVFTAGAVAIDADARTKLEGAGITIETAPITKLVVDGDRLGGIALANDTIAPCDALFAHPPQRHVELVRSLGLELDEEGFVRVDAMKRETSIPGIYATGDLATRMQGALLAAATGTQAASMINVDLAMG